jgi:formate-dependent nitrite reductase membrane component NrfD
MPVMIVAVRLLFDPQQIPYYWVALVLCLSVGAWARLSGDAKLLWPLTTGGAFLALTIPYLISGTAQRAIHTVALVVLVPLVFCLAGVRERVTGRP